MTRLASKNPAAQIDLAWWPPDPDESIGHERAQELSAAIRDVVTPLLDETEQDRRGHQG